MPSLSAFVVKDDLGIRLSNALSAPLPMNDAVLLLLNPNTPGILNGDMCRFMSDVASQLLEAILSEEDDNGLSPSDVVDIAEGVEKLSLEVVVRLDEDGVDILPEPNPPSNPLSRLSPFDDDPEELRPLLRKQFWRDSVPPFP